MKIERMHITASNVPTRSARKIKAESNQTLSDDAVTFDADRQNQQKHQELPEQLKEDPEEEETAILAASEKLSRNTSIDIVV